MRSLKVFVVIVCAVSITALGIEAADTLTGSSTRLLGQLISNEATCPEGMIATPQLLSVGCIDQYEASPSATCPHKSPKNPIETSANTDDPSCAAISKAETVPWRFITRDQAATMCLRAGKRLPSNEEWYQLALGTPDTGVCNTTSDEVAETGSSVACKSAVGVYDAVGNVWEWTSEEAIHGMYNGRNLPKSGYVVEVDRAGIATLTSEDDASAYGDDYFWSRQEGVSGMIRGGFYRSLEDAGVFSTHADTAPSTATAGLGFRCVL